ncbi:hypothetical protein LEP1GSC192_1809 [Leptospira sp. B5-022]|nr:hypothetical protein LEP1GSC192_1809 [Leptospira sp. B5-022]
MISLLHSLSLSWYSAHSKRKKLKKFNASCFCCGLDEESV